MLVTALTGDVGAGKSTLMRVWRGMGANTVSADEVAKEQWERPEIARIARERWGRAVYRPDGSPDFAEIARRAFSSDEEHRFTNSLLHPPTMTEIARRVRGYHGWIAVEIPLLYEVGVPDWVDCVIYAAAPAEKRAERNAPRGLDAAEIERRESRLLPSLEKAKRSDIVLLNDGSFDEWEEAAQDTGLRLSRAAGVTELSTCCPTRSAARKIASVLIESRLAACANIDPVESVYRWQDSVETAEEWRMTCKTTAGSRREAASCIRRHHPYELPAITANEMMHADLATLEWVARSCAR